jgi:hypothetical protein
MKLSQRSVIPNPIKKLRYVIDRGLAPVGTYEISNTQTITLMRIKPFSHFRLRHLFKL